MKNFVVAAAAVAAFGFVGAASAADMAVKAPIYKAPPVALYNWTGFYVGVQVGGPTSGTRRTYPAPHLRFR